MSETAKRDTDEKRYLLRDLSEEESARMEEAFFADDSKFESVELAEDELIDSYIRNELTPAEREQFRAMLAGSPRLVERVHFARVLAEAAHSFPAIEAAQSLEPVSFESAKPKSRHGWLGGLFAQQPAFGIPLAVCAAVILVAGVVLTSHLRRESARREAERAAVQRQKEDSERLAREQKAQLDAEQRARELPDKDLPSPDDSPRTDNSKETQDRQPAISNFATVFLTPGLLRSGSGRKSELILKPETTTVRIQLGLEKNEYASYIATIKTVDDETVLVRPGLKPHITRSGAHLLVFVPAKNLTPDDYKVHLNGVTAAGQVEEVMDYVLRVIKR